MLILSISLVAGSGAQIFVMRGGRNALFEKTFCHGRDCADERLIEHAFRRLWMGEHLATSIELSQETLRRNPNSPYRWSDLGEIALQAGDGTTAKYCFARAEELGSGIPQILIRLANFHAGIGETREMLSYSARALHLAPQYYPTILGSYRRSGIDLRDILARGLPPDPLVIQPFFRSLLAAGRVSEIELAWSWMSSHALVDQALANDYREFLLREDAGSLVGRH